MAIVQSAQHESRATDPGRFFNIREYLESGTYLLSAIGDYRTTQQQLGTELLDEEAKWLLRDKASVIYRQGVVLVAHLRQALPLSLSVIGNNQYFNQPDWYGSGNLFFRLEDDGTYCLFGELRSLPGEEDFRTANYEDYIRLAEDVLLASG